MLIDKFNDATDTPEIPKWLSNTKILTTNPIKYLCCKPGENVTIPIIPLAREFYAAYRQNDTQKYDQLSNEIRTTILTKYFDLDRIDNQYREKDVNYIDGYSVGELVWSAINGFIFGFFNCDEVNLLLETYVRLTPKYWKYYLSKMTDIYPPTIITYFMPDESKWDGVSQTTLHVTCKYMEKYDALYAKLEEDSIQLVDNDIAAFEEPVVSEPIVNPEVLAATVAEEIKPAEEPIISSTPEAQETSTPVAVEPVVSKPVPQPTHKTSFAQPLVNIVTTDNSPFITFDCTDDKMVNISDLKFDLLMPTA